jgi:hypothetical protein
MTYNQTQVRTGGGCRPIGIHRPQRTVPLFISNPEEWARQQAASLAKQKADHELWLKTPEGIAWIRKEELRLEAERLAAEEIAKEQKRLVEWNQRVKTLDEQSLVGVVVYPTMEYYISIVQNPTKSGELSVYALLRTVCDYPQEPYRTFGSYGRWGLKVFLNRKSRDLLEKENSAEFDSARNGYMGYINSKLPIKILGLSQSKKSAQGELL